MFANAGAGGNEEFFMAEDRNDASRFGGQYMIQDRDHMSGISQETDKADRGVRQSDQSQSGGRQQGGDDHGAASQQGGGRRRPIL